MSILTVTGLQPGESARILEPSRPGEIPLRLRELGFVPGTELRISRRAPLGDPLEIEIRGYRVCLRKAELATIRVSRG